MSPIALLPALLVALPSIDGATVNLAEGNLKLEIATSEPVARHDVRVKMDGKTMSVYVDGAEALARKSFGTAELGGSILPRADYAKIEVPLRAEMGCAGKPVVTVTDASVRAVLPCKAIETAPAEAPVAAEAKPEAKIESPAAEAPKAEAPKVEPVKAEAPKVEPVKPAKPESKAAAIAAPVAPKAAPKFSSMPAIVMAGLLLVGGYFIWRKKKQKKASLIRILETASLGPKRALVIAEVNGEKMILGTSEAGISLLSPMAGGQAAPVAARAATPLAAALAGAAFAGTAGAAAAKAEPTIDDENDSDDAAASDGEGGLLAKLFKRRRQIEADASEDGPSTMAEDFRDLLNDSLEDEELRRRLQAGLGGRTQ